MEGIVDFQRSVIEKEVERYFIWPGQKTEITFNSVIRTVIGSMAAGLVAIYTFWKSTKSKKTKEPKKKDSKQSLS